MRHVVPWKAVGTPLPLPFASYLIGRQSPRLHVTTFVCLVLFAHVVFEVRLKPDATYLPSLYPKAQNRADPTNTLQEYRILDKARPGSILLRACHELACELDAIRVE